MKKSFLFAVFLLQMLSFQLDAISPEGSENEIKTYIEYASGWTGSGLADDINTKLEALQQNAAKEKKFLNIRDVKLTPEWGQAFIVYEISNQESELSAVSTHLDYVSGWTGSGLANDMNAKLDWLQKSAENENRLLTIKDIQFTPEWGFAFIIYKISGPPNDRSKSF